MIKTTTRRTWLSAALVATVLAISGTPALAESPWRFQLTPDAWLVGSTGELRPVGTNLTVDFDESFTDILEDLDGAFFITGSVRKDRFVLLADFAWAALSRSGHVRVPTVGGGPAEGKVRQREQHAALAPDEIEHHVVRRPSQTFVAEAVCFMTRRSKVAQQFDREVLVELEPHASLRGRRLSSRASSAAYARAASMWMGSSVG